MKLLSKLEINIKKGTLPILIDCIYKNNCEIQNIELVECSNKEESFNIELIYHTRKNFISIQKEINGNSEFKLISIYNEVENYINGGLLNISGKVPIESMNDFQTAVIGAYNLIIEKLNGKNGFEYTGISKNVGLITGLNSQGGVKKNDLLKLYTLAESDSIIVNKFCNLNAFPIIIKYNIIEDFIKALQKIEETFSIIRLMSIDGADISVYNQVSSILGIPVVSREKDDIPIHLLSLIRKIIKKSKSTPGDTTLGFVGVDVSAIRVTSCLMKMGYRRVLGCGDEDKALLSFENKGGMATTTENILSNADIVVILKKDLDNSEFNNVRAGQYYISFYQDRNFDLKNLFSKGVKEFITMDDLTLSSLFPGILSGVYSSNNKKFDDNEVIELSEKLAEFFDVKYELPNVFTDIHDKISEVVKEIIDKKE